MFSATNFGSEKVQSGFPLSVNFLIVRLDEWLKVPSLRTCALFRFKFAAFDDDAKFGVNA